MNQQAIEQIPKAVIIALLTGTIITGINHWSAFFGEAGPVSLVSGRSDLHLSRSGIHLCDEERQKAFCRARVSSNKTHLKITRKM